MVHEEAIKKINGVVGVIRLTLQKNDSISELFVEELHNPINYILDNSPSDGIRDKYDEILKTLKSCHEGICNREIDILAVDARRIANLLMMIIKMASPSGYMETESSEPNTTGVKKTKPLAETIRTVLRLKPELKDKPAEAFSEVEKIMLSNGWGETDRKVFDNSPGWLKRYKQQTK